MKRTDRAHLLAAPHLQRVSRPADKALYEAIRRTRAHLLGRQHSDGHWTGEVTGDPTLESDYVLLLTWLGRGHDAVIPQAAESIARRQSSAGGWNGFRGGPLSVSASVKAYLALKLAGLCAADPSMQRARDAILAAGGADEVDGLTRYSLALAGAIDYEACPVLPPELVLIPHWLPGNIYELSAWSRPLLVSLSVLWHCRPVLEPDRVVRIDELFVRAAQDANSGEPDTREGAAESGSGLPRTADGLRLRRRDRFWRMLDRWRVRPLRPVALRSSRRWILDHLEDTDGLGATAPSIMAGVVALRCLGCAVESPPVSGGLAALEDLCRVDDGALRMQSSRRAVRDTAATALALREAGLAWNAPAMLRAGKWLLSAEVRTPGDWAVHENRASAGGWAAQSRNRFYPSIPTTALVLAALQRLLPEHEGRAWQTNFLPPDGSCYDIEEDPAAAISGRTPDPARFVLEMEQAAPALSAMSRGLNWLLLMQCRDGGWAAFDRDQSEKRHSGRVLGELIALFDPPAADIAAQVLEACAALGVTSEHRPARRAVEFILQRQHATGEWTGACGVSAIYGTWRCLSGLVAMGVPVDAEPIRRGARWLRSLQQECGGWGESPPGSTDSAVTDHAAATATRTAWAVMGLMAAAYGADSLSRGVRFLLDTQNPDGTWPESACTTVGLPRATCVPNDLDSAGFPLLALARYARFCETSGS